MSTDPAATPAPANPHEPNWAAYTRSAGVAALAGLALYVAAGILNYAAASGHEAQDAAKRRFALAYLSGFTFWFSLPLGAMSLLMIAYLTKTSWGLLLRRPFEAAMRTLPLIVLLFLPIVLVTATGAASPYWWTHPEDTHVEPAAESGGPPEGGADKREQTVKTGQYMIRKAVEHERKEREAGNYGFLSVPAFIGVAVVVFAIWGTLIFFLDKWGKEASDEANPARVDAALEKLKNISGPGLIIYALTMTAAATQWVMSLEPSWSSTMFPVIFAVNQFLTCFAFCLAMFLLFVSRPPLRDIVRPKFQLDMGTLMLAFTLFWSYTSFSQFMLVWIGNLPEEIPFFLKRSAGGWWYVSASLIALHFALPFLLLLFRDIKLHPVRLRAVAVFILVICAVDVVWWVAPAVQHPGGFPYWVMDVGAVIGIGGVWGVWWVWHLKQRPLFPASQTFLLPEGHHEHH